MTNLINLAEEIWKDVVGFEGNYLVSSLGRIFSCGRVVKTCHGATQFRKGKMRSTKIEQSYPAVSLSVDAKFTTVRVHRLVAQAFIPNPNNYKEINHKNGIRSDNRVENLEWCTRSENNKHSYKIGLAKPVKSWLGRINTPDRSFPISQLSLDGKLIKVWPSTAEVRRQLGYNESSIGYCAKGKFSQSYGFRWVRSPKIVPPTQVPQKCH